MQFAQGKPVGKDKWACQTVQLLPQELLCIKVLPFPLLFWLGSCH